MTAITISSQPMTAAVFLFGETKDSVDVLARALQKQGVGGALQNAVSELSQAGRNAVKKVPSAGLKAVLDEIATEAYGQLLNHDLGDLVIAGCKKYEKLRTAAQRTLANRDSTELVELAHRPISSIHHPSVEVKWEPGDVYVATVTFELSVKFDLQGIATVRHGRLVSISGDCDAAATVGWCPRPNESRLLAKREAHFQLPLLVRLGAGIPLLHDIEPPTKSLPVEAA
jgi:hypothetical protein